MPKPLTERPALLGSEMGLLLLGLVLVFLGLVNLAGAFKAGGLAFLAVGRQPYWPPHRDKGQRYSWFPYTPK